MSSLVQDYTGGWTARPIGEFYESLRIIGPAVSTVQSAASDGFGFGAVMGGAATVFDVASFVVDPIGSMAASAAAFLLDYMPPLPAMLESLVGDPGAVRAVSGTWGNIENHLRSCSEDIRSKINSVSEFWKGEAAQAYQNLGRAFADSTNGVADSCASVAVILEGMAAIVELTKNIVRDLIADLVGRLISWAAEIACTVGIGATWVVPQAVTAILRVVGKVQQWIKGLLQAVAKVSKYVENIRTLASVLIDKFTTISNALDSVNAKALLDFGSKSAIEVGITRQISAHVPSLKDAAISALSLPNIVNMFSSVYSTADDALKAHD